MFNIKNSWERKQLKGYPFWFWQIDMHGTIFANNYVKGSFGGPFFEDALNPLRFLSKLPEAKLILWTSSHRPVIDAALADLKKKGIKFDFVNENPLIPSDDLCDFSQKPYFDICLDDKANFNPVTDWKLIEQELIDLFAERYYGAEKK